LEFLDPPFQKVIKENIGKTIISLIRNSLQEMIKQNILFCDLISFIQQNSNSTSKKELSSGNRLEAQAEDSSNAKENLGSSKITSKKNSSLLVIERERSKDRSSAYKSGENNNDKNGQGSNTALSNKKLLKIFYAIENNYYGVIKVSKVL
jgi:hypothetical protein